ncbi:MAG: sulfotransferase domain-containing protein [Planctomycetota bacterium]
MLTAGLHHKNGFIRKGSAFALQFPKAVARFAVDAKALQQRPPVLANSFPKSGTHLLDQIVDGLPGIRNYGAFLSSMTSSFRFTERSDAEVHAFIERFVPSEMIRGHLFYGPEAAEWLSKRHTVHYFIYRDPRDVVLSETHYLRSLNRWHKMHPYFRDAPSMDAAISLSILGLQGSVTGLNYQNANDRFQRYAGWIDRNDVCALKFEDLTSERREQEVRRMLDFYNERAGDPVEIQSVLPRMLDGMRPEKSHTYRKGKSGGWREKFSEEHKVQFKEVAGQTLIDLGYESDLEW